MYQRCLINSPVNACNWWMWVQIPSPQIDKHCLSFNWRFSILVVRPISIGKIQFNSVARLICHIRFFSERPCDGSELITLVVNGRFYNGGFGLHVNTTNVICGL